MKVITESNILWGCSSFVGCNPIPQISLSDLRWSSISHYLHKICNVFLTRVTTKFRLPRSNSETLLNSVKSQIVFWNFFDALSSVVLWSRSKIFQTINPYPMIKPPPLVAGPGVTRGGFNHRFGRRPKKNSACGGLLLKIEYPRGSKSAAGEFFFEMGIRRTRLRFKISRF